MQHRCEGTILDMGRLRPDAVGKMVPQKSDTLWESNIAMTATLKKGKSATFMMSRMASLMLKLMTSSPLNFPYTKWGYIPFSIQSGKPSRSRCDLGPISSIGFISGFQSVEPFLHWKSADPFFFQGDLGIFQPILAGKSAISLIYRAISLMHRIE